MSIGPRWCAARSMHVVARLQRRMNSTGMLKEVFFYKKQEGAMGVLEDISMDGVNGCIVCDVSNDHELSLDLPKSWGMIVLTSPNEDNYKEWAPQRTALQVIINCPTTMEMRAVCAWMKRECAVEEQEEFWEVVSSRIDEVGPLPRYVFGSEKYAERVDAFSDAVKTVDSSTALYCGDVNHPEVWGNYEASHKLVRIVRFDGKSKTERFHNAPLSERARGAMIIAVGRAFRDDAVLRAFMLRQDMLLVEALEKYGMQCFLNENFVGKIRERLKELRPRNSNRIAKKCVLQMDSTAHPTESKGVSAKSSLSERMLIEKRVLYLPAVSNFPLVDAFFFVEMETEKTLVGVQTTTAGRRHTTSSTVLEFVKHMAAAFAGWEEYSKGLSWEIICVQHKDSNSIAEWQRCDISKRNDDEHKQIADLWNNNVRQYQAAICSEDIITREVHS